MAPTNKDKIRALLKSIETGDTKAVSVVNEDRYIQHNPHTNEGSEGLTELFLRLSKTSPRVEVVRVFEDDDFVFAHTEYDFADQNVGFEVFRFEDGRAVEHWDNIQSREGPNAAGNTMTNGPTEATDQSRTEANRQTIRAFVHEVLIRRETEQLGSYTDPREYIEHSPSADEPDDPFAALTPTGSAPDRTYATCHRVLAEGNFVLSICEGIYEGVHSSLYDLYRLANDKIVEHWDTIDAIPPESEWNNANGKF